MINVGRLFRIQILLVLLFACLTWYAEGTKSGDPCQKQADAYWQQAKQLAQQGKILAAARMYATCADTERGCAAPRLADMASALHQAGFYYAQAMQEQEALAAYQESLVLFRQLNKDLPSATVLNNLGSLYKDRRDYARALEYYQQALAIARGLQKEDSSAVYLGNIAKVYTLQGNDSESLWYYEQALTLQQRLGKDAAAAVTLNNIGIIHNRQGRYEEARQCYQQALVINRKSGQNTQIAINLNNLGSLHENWGNYVEALSYYQQALELKRQAGQEDDLFISLSNIGGVYKIQGNYQQALHYYQQALELAQKHNRKAERATILNNIGVVYSKTGAYEKALDAYDQALAIKRALGVEHETGAILSNIGEVYRLWGQYEEALALHQQALDLDRRLGRQAAVGITLNNISVLYNEWGRYDLALEYGQHALEIATESGNHADIGVHLSNLGRIYENWGSYDKSLEAYQQALKIAEQTGQRAEAAARLNSIGFVYKAWGQLERALDFHQQALEIARPLDLNRQIGIYLNNIGAVYEALQDYERARDVYQQALTIALRLEADADISIRLNNLGTLELELAQFSHALDYFQQALERDRLRDRKPEMAVELSNIGMVFFKQAAYVEALPYFEEAVTIIEQVRKTASGAIRRDYLAKQIGVYHHLITCYIRLGDFSKAFEIMELSRAKLLTEQLARAAEIAPPTLKQIQQTLPADTAVIIYTNTSYQALLSMVITREGVTASEYPLAEWLQQSMLIAPAADDSPSIQERGLTPDKQPTHNTEVAQFPESLDVATIIARYRWQLLHPSSVRGFTLHSQSPQSPSAEPDLSVALYELLIGKIQEHIHGKHRVIIAPDGVFTLLPFETLRNSQGTYLIEQYQISYTQSLSVLESIRQRQYPTERNPLLAFGGAVYDTNTYAVDVADNEAQLAYLHRQVETAIRQGRPVGKLYARLRNELWSNLPGTLAEVMTIQQVVNGAAIITGDQATEAQVKTLNVSGALARYRVLHFATHGDADARIPELSAIVLSLSPEEDKNDAPAGQEGDGVRGKQQTRDMFAGLQEDGYLRAGEVQHLQLQADFVNLSACETGLGRVYKGEGMVGLTQAFLIAGANGVSVSLWQVADDSTAQFMVALYTLVEHRKITFRDAMTEVKRRFVRGDFGEAWKAPYYWGPFVYYGE